MLPLILKTNLRQRAISELTKQEMQSLRKVILSLQILDIDHVHESFLPWLAWWFRAEQWDDSWSIEQKRAAVKEALVLFRYKGTAWAVERAIKLNGFDSTVIPWHTQSPIGTNGTFTVNVPVNNMARSVDNALQTTISNAIEKNKRGSQHWDIEYEINDEKPIYIGAYKAAVYDITIGPRPPQPNVYGEALAAPYITVYEHIEILLK
ncbi:phage tail protein I [Vibrio sp. Sgm 5]|uniref:phage tail protein I n=1 Tax=Vibrio sp. Sgm 5 TaxID=2994387 RepID=UPI0022491857|nr:phage tail protein I [Vibrio sp. Sgm 5]MCX2788337.1 phage tail protein I [Vibrio sp. Sgm 5]